MLILILIVLIVLTTIGVMANNSEHYRGGGGGRGGGGRGGWGGRGAGRGGRGGWSGGKGPHYNPRWRGRGGGYGWGWGYSGWPWWYYHAVYDYPIYTVQDVVNYANDEWCWAMMTKQEAQLPASATRSDWLKWAKDQGMTVLLFPKSSADHVLVQVSTQTGRCFIPSNGDISQYDFRKLV